MVTTAMKECCEEVRAGAFPDDREFCYPVVEGEEEKFMEMMNK